MTLERTLETGSDTVMASDLREPVPYAAELEALALRRRQVLGEGDAVEEAELQKVPRVGLALSGGGLRSATFGLGLMRGLASHTGPSATDDDPSAIEARLAQDGLLGRIDYLSTVSGGGYVGAMWGRLVSRVGIQRAQALMRESGSPVLEWLRRNGRYLTPDGARDMGVAVATYLRSWLAIHTEFMVACWLLGAFVMAPHIWQHSTQTLNVSRWATWGTVWWPMAVLLWLSLAPGLVTGYWTARDAPEPKATRRWPAWRDVFLLMAGFGALAALLAHVLKGAGFDLARDALTVPLLGTLVLGSAVLGALFTHLRVAFAVGDHALTVSRLRERLTGGLKQVTLAAAACALFGALDAVSWWLMAELLAGNAVLWGGIGLGGLGVLLLRALAPALQSLATQAETESRRWLPALAHAAGVVGVVALVLAWLVALQWWVFSPDPLHAVSGWSPWQRVLPLAGVWAVWVAFTAGNAQMANASSLHNFYRARLSRAYLGVGNLLRDPGERSGARADVTAVLAGDDIPLGEHHPEQRGGPIHLITACLNQTRDDASGLYNADRKGTALTASWRGFEVGHTRFVPAQPGQDSGTLARWVAVSGAAASPGAGSYTSRGLSLLLYFLGVRLGHWMRAPAPSPEDGGWMQRLAWRLLPKPMMLASEATASFRGAAQPWWYLSDGGHFENTGVYPLLKRELDFIIVSDAGCDPGYRYADLENLVRKARIDFGADIEFYTQDEAARCFPSGQDGPTVLSPESLASNHASRGVLLARVRYRERMDAQGRRHRPEGTLLVLKPSLHDALDLDVLAYARHNPAFPHEGIGDQAFDEAQWESYHRLGEDLGQALTPEWLASLPGWSAPASHPLRVAARLHMGPVLALPASEPLWRQQVRTAAVGTTLGLGAFGGVAMAMWQVQSQWERHRADQQAQVKAVLAEVSAGLTGVTGRCAPVTDQLLSQVSDLMDLRDLPGASVDQGHLTRLAARLQSRCQAVLAAEGAPCEDALVPRVAELCAVVLKPGSQDLALSYWQAAGEASSVSAGTLENTAPTREGRRVESTLPSASASGGRSAVQSGTTVRRAPAPAWEPVAPARSTVTPALSALGPPPSHDGVDGVVAALAQACGREGPPVRLHVQVHGADGLAEASALVERLRRAAPGQLLVAPVDDVVGRAQLRGVRPPMAWPQPTFVVHRPQDQACASALGQMLLSEWPSVGGAAGGAPVIRPLRRQFRQAPSPVIELWLPSPVTQQ